MTGRAKSFSSNPKRFSFGKPGLTCNNSGKTGWLNKNQKQ